jgi:hypothetical protein
LSNIDKYKYIDKKGGKNARGSYLSGIFQDIPVLFRNLGSKEF